MNRRTLSFFLLFILQVYLLLGGTIQLLENEDKNVVERILIEEIPDFPLRSIKVISEGWDNIVAEINGEWIFRFPRSVEGLPVMVREQKLLDYLQGRISLLIPNFHYFGKKTAFVGYRKIPGKKLDEPLYLQLSEKTRQEMADSLALFLTQLHQSVSIQQAAEWGYEHYRAPLNWIDHSLLGTLPSEEIERIVKEALIYAKENQRPQFLVLLHNDLHGDNFAFDVKKEKVTGVFDFSDAAIGDYSVEFGKLFCVHDDLALRTAQSYAALNGVPNPLVPAAADYILRRCSYLLYARECGNTQREKSLIRMLREFVPIWDSLKRYDEIEQLIPQSEKIKQIESFKGGYANNVAKVVTDKGAYLFRSDRVKRDADQFAKMTAIATLASQKGLAPEVVAINFGKQQLLLRYIEHEPWPLFEENPQPYYETMHALRQFHEEVSPSFQMDEENGYFPFSFIRVKGKELLQTTPLPSCFEEALDRMEGLYSLQHPWLKKHAVLCHGDFHKWNVLLAREGENLKPYLIDFDTFIVGDPLLDVAKFSLRLPQEAREALLSAYLGIPSLSESEKGHFERTDCSLLMVVAITRFDAAKPVDGDTRPRMSQSEMDELIDSTDPLPSFLSVPYNDSSPVAKQRGALYALAEFLCRSRLHSTKKRIR